MQLATAFLDFIKTNELFGAQDTILLGVSGGKDSVLMAHLFAKAGFKFAIAHCNFKLRGEDADGDEFFVKALAKAYQVPFYTISFDTVSYAKENSLSIEMAARSLRYTWFEQIRYTHHYDYIAVAHHQNDSVETVLMNLVRGTGIAGLHGILPKRGYLIRPLLFLNSEEVAHAVAERALNFRNDESNFSTAYTRNKIRLEVVPRLKEINPALEKTFVENSTRFRALEELLQKYTNTLRSQLFQQKSDDEYRIAIADLMALSPLEILLYELFKPYRFTMEVLHDLLASWEGQNRTGKRFYSDSHALLINRDELILERKTRVDHAEQKLEPGHLVTFCDYTIGLIYTEGIQKINQKDRISIDADKLILPLSIRSWRQGDTFRPLGMQGKKKLSDFFISLKIPLSVKRKIPLIINGNGEIIWVPPYRMDNRYKITDKTKKVAILECR